MYSNLFAKPLKKAGPHNLHNKWDDETNDKEEKEPSPSPRRSGPVKFPEKLTVIHTFGVPSHYKSGITSYWGAETWIMDVLAKGKVLLLAESGRGEF